MSDAQGGGQIASAVSAIKPDYRDIDPDRIAQLISRGSSGEKVVITDVRGGGANAGASSGVVVFRALIGSNEQDYVLRYAPMNRDGRIFVEYCIPEQFVLQRKLASAGLPVPMGQWIDPDGTVLGLPGFIMDKVEGDVAHAAPFQAGLIGDSEPDVRDARIHSIMAMLDCVHKTDWRILDLALDVRGAGIGTPVERYLAWFWKTAEWSRPEQLGRLEAVRRKLIAEQPNEHVDDLALIHGDPALGNYMLRGTEAVAVIDWELAGILPPAYDIAMQCLANSYYRSLSEPEIAARIPSDAEWIAMFERVSGNRIANLDYYRRVAACVLLVVQLSMARNFVGPAREAYLQGIEPVWAVAEST